MSELDNREIEQLCDLELDSVWANWEDDIIIALFDGREKIKKFVNDKYAAQIRVMHGANIILAQRLLKEQEKVAALENENKELKLSLKDLNY